jgi:hypothetical protein
MNATDKQKGLGYAERQLETALNQYELGRNDLALNWLNKVNNSLGLLTWLGVDTRELTIEAMKLEQKLLEG